VQVSVATAILENFEPERWDADVYGAMAVASQFSSLVKKRAASVKLAYKLNRLNSLLSKLFEEIHKGIE
jgi:hypothetical protein